MCSFEESHTFIIYLLKSVILHLFTKPIEEINNSQLTDSNRNNCNIMIVTNGKSKSAHVQISVAFVTLQIMSLL